jgi:hypothetical protein
MHHLFLVYVGIALTLLSGCGSQSGFDVAMRKFQASLSVGVTKDQFRTKLQDLAGASDGSKRSNDILAVYKDSLDLWELMDASIAKEFRSRDKSLGISNVKNDEILDDGINKPEKINWLRSMLQLAKKHPEIVASKKDLGFSDGTLSWVVPQGAVKVLWDKAAAL